MATFELDEEQCEAIYLALRGDSNEATLLKTKKMLELQRLPAAVTEVQGQLIRLQGSGVQNPGLLRIFNPQHDLLTDTQQAADAVNKADKKAKAKDDTRDMFADDGKAGDEPTGTGGVSDEPTPEPAAPSAITWGNDVPNPRPNVGQLIMQPSGMSASIGEVLGYDGERAAFRVVDVDGWDGFIFNYGYRNSAHWRILTQALEYADASDMSKQPLGSPAAIANELRYFGQRMLEAPPAATPEGYIGLADYVLPLLHAINTTLNPDYITAVVTEETAGAEDNRHALARLIIQHADMIEAVQEVASTGTTLADETSAALHTALADEADDDEEELPPGSPVDDDDDGPGSDDDDEDDDDEAHRDREAEAIENNDAEQDAKAAAGTAVEQPGKPVSRQRARNAASNGLVKAPAARKVGAKPAAKKAAPKKGK